MSNEQETSEQGNSSYQNTPPRNAEETQSRIAQDDIYVIADGAGGYTGHNLNYGCDSYCYSDDIWGTDTDGELLCSVRRAANKLADSSKNLFIDVLLPSGFLMPVQCPALRTLEQLKHDIYIQAKKLPPSARLVDVSDYIFSAIGLNGVRVELYDERKSVSSLFTSCLPLFELIQPEGSAEDKTLTQKISTVIGFPLLEIERQLNEELAEFRLELFAQCCKIAEQRGVDGTRHYAFYLESLVIPLAMKPVGGLHDESEVNENDIDCVQYPENPEEIKRRSLFYLEGRMDLMETYVEVWWTSDDTNQNPKFTHFVHLKEIFNCNAMDIIFLALENLRQIADVPPEDKPTDYILQIAGQRVFIDDDETEFTDFKYIRSSLENCRKSYLLLRKRATVFQHYPPPPPIFVPAFCRRQAQEQQLKSISEFSEQKYHLGHTHSAGSTTKSFWDLDENLRIRLISLSKVGVSGEDKVYVRVAVAVGNHLLDVQQTVLIEPTKGRFMENGLLEFGIYVKDVPECAHFSFTLICVRGAARATSSNALSRLGNGEPLGWANYRVFDWRRKLFKGKQTISLWPFPKEIQQKTLRAKELNLHLSGPIHYADINEPVACVEVEFDDYKDERSVIYEFPDDDTIFRFNAVLEERRLAVEREIAVTLPPEPCDDISDLTSAQKYEIKMKQLQVAVMQEKLRMKNKILENLQLTSKDSDNEENECCDSEIYDLRFRGLLTPNCPEFHRLYCLHRCLDGARLKHTDQLFLWHMRYKLCELFPQLIVLLADCTYVWCDRERTCEFYALLRIWPPLRVETAIELLDGRYTDASVRNLAVNNLDKSLVTDDELRLHLLVLVQSVRYEPYASSPLVLMLIKRSILSYRIAHTVFWLLRAELAHLLSNQNGSSSKKLSFLYLRYALMLEAICRANIAHLDSTIKQVEMVSQLTYLSTMIRNLGGNKDVASKKLQQELAARKELLQYMDSPLNPIDRLGELNITGCRVLGSAKMPLRLEWSNPEPTPENTTTTTTHQLIFKNGDDMRQDMLTIQVMRIMDSKWKGHDCDYCMTLYDVLPMGRNIGLIQVVQNCQTLFEIQCGTRPLTSSLNMDTNLLHKFLYRNYNKSNHYVERVERFSASLAGYCVATFVIGIRDRHQDNIMIADDGRIFHIDFGHFLGHTKRKLGINRERTDFILTEQFLSAISHCKDYRKSHEFKIFRDKCIKAFMIVYDQARFYVVLFRMMLCMGLPELSAQENVDFLRDTLMYSETERTKVYDAFQTTFDQAIRGDWSVSVNWFFHTVKHM